MKEAYSRQAGSALIVSLVALLVLSLLGIRTISDVLNQSSVVRNEQFRQKVFYAASSELNVQINAVNRNSQSEDDPIIDSLLQTGSDGTNLQLAITRADDPKIITDPADVILESVAIKGDRIEHIGCPGEEIGSGNVLAGEIDATATLDDGRGSIKSSQRQRYLYCWP